MSNLNSVFTPAQVDDLLSKGMQNLEFVKAYA